MKRFLTMLVAEALLGLTALAVGVSPVWAKLDPGSGGGAGGPGPVSSGATNGALIAGIAVGAVVVAVAIVLIALRVVRRRRPAAASPIDMPERAPTQVGQPAEKSHNEPKAA